MLYFTKTNKYDNVIKGVGFKNGIPLSLICGTCGAVFGFHFSTIDDQYRCPNNEIKWNDIPNGQTFISLETFQHYFFKYHQMLINSKEI